MRTAICQIHSGADKDQNLAEISRLAEQAAASGVDLAVFPEFAMYDVPDLTSEAIAHAEPLDGPFVTRLGALAERTGITLVAGMMEAIPGDQRAHNTLVAVSSGGRLIRHYRKAHLYDAFGHSESDVIRPGELDGPATFEVAGVTVGMLTCYDLRFPEPARQHADAGVELLLYPAAWIPGPRKEDHWNTLVRARAIENTLYVAAVSQAPPQVGTGGSLIADPMGLTLAELDGRIGLATAEIRPSRVAEVRETNPSLANRRFAVVPA